jgi:hypothetical protein
MRLFRKTSMGMALVAAVEALRLLSGSPVLAASEKDVIVVNTPAAPVPVTGVVEVMNDALYQPYIRLASVFLTGGTTREVSFDIPDGKRLVVETVSVQADVPAGQKVHVMLDVLEGISPVLSVVPVQSPGPFLGVEYYVANLPFKLRKDAMPGTTDEIRVRMIRDSSAGDAGLAATIHGYLVDR